MRVTSAHIFLILSVAFAEWTLPLSAQQLPADARPWQLVRTLIQVTGSPDKNIDRDAFRSRLTGEAAAIDAEALKGTWPAFTDVNIDTIIVLPARIVERPADPKAKLPARRDTIERTLIYVTTYVNGLHDNCYFFCERDSIWHIESWRQFPTPTQRTEIIEQVNNPDTSRPDNFRMRLNLTRLLLSDGDLGLLFAEIRDDANRTAPQLARSRSWNQLDLSQISFDSVGEYDGLDDEISSSARLFYRLNFSALERLQDFGIERISRLTEHDGVVLLELGTSLGHSIGFLYASDSNNLPLPGKEDFFALKPLTGNWWLFKRRAAEPPEAILPLGPGPRSFEHRSGKASYLVPKDTGS